MWFAQPATAAKKRIADIALEKGRKPWNVIFATRLVCAKVVAVLEKEPSGLAIAAMEQVAMAIPLAANAVATANIKY